MQFLNLLSARQSSHVGPAIPGGGGGGAGGGGGGGGGGAPMGGPVGLAAALRYTVYV